MHSDIFVVNTAGYDSTDLKHYQKQGWIASCCGAYVAPTWDEFVDNTKGICVYITKDKHQLPENTREVEWSSIDGDAGDIIYIKELCLRDNYYKQPARNNREPQLSVYCSIYVNTYLQLQQPSVTKEQFQKLRHYKEETLDDGYKNYLNQVDYCKNIYKKRWEAVEDAKESYKYFFFILTPEQSKVAEIFHEFGDIVFQSRDYRANTNTRMNERLQLTIVKKHA